MVNIQISDATSITTYLASVIVSFSCFSRLSAPIWSIVIGIKSTFPIRIVFTFHFISLIFAFTSITAKAAISMIGKKPINCIWGFANLTYKFNLVFLSMSRLFCSKLASALIGAKAIWSICPILKFFIAPFTYKYRFFRRIHNTFIATFAGTILLPFLTLRYFKNSIAMFASLFNAFCFPESVMTFLIAKLRIAESFSWLVKFFAAKMTDEIMFFVTGHFNTSCCVEVLNSKGAHGSGSPCLSAGSYSAQAL